MTLSSRKLSKHPWAKYRRSAGFTQLDVADRLGVTRHYVIRLEQSLFWHPTDSTIAKLAQWYGVDMDEFEMSYYDYVRDKRRTFKALHKSFEEAIQIPYGLRMHPLVAYRQIYSYSRVGLCKALCLHQDNIRDYELNLQRGAPDQLVHACEEMGWMIEPLEHAVSDWRLSGNADKLRASRR